MGYTIKKPLYTTKPIVMPAPQGVSGYSGQIGIQGVSGYSGQIGIQGHAGMAGSQGLSRGIQGIGYGDNHRGIPQEHIAARGMGYVDENCEVHMTKILSFDIVQNSSIGNEISNPLTINDL